MADYDLASRRPMGEGGFPTGLFEDPTRINGVRPYQIGRSLEPVSLAGHGSNRPVAFQNLPRPPVWRARRCCGLHQESQRGNGSVVRTELAITTVARWPCSL